MPRNNRAILYGAITIAVVAGVGVGAWKTTHGTPKLPKGMAYTASGYGGYVSAKQPSRPLPTDPVQPAIKRIGRFHGGNIPADAEAVWKQAMATAQTRDRAAPGDHVAHAGV